MPFHRLLNIWGKIEAFYVMLIREWNKRLTTHAKGRLRLFNPNAYHENIHQYFEKRYANDVSKVNEIQAKVVRTLVCVCVRVENIASHLADFIFYFVFIKQQYMANYFK